MGTLPGRSKAEKGKEVTEEEGEVRREDSDVMIAVLTAGPIESVTIHEMRNAERSSRGDAAEKPFQHAGQSWDCSKMEDESEKKDAMD